MRYLLHLLQLFIFFPAFAQLSKPAIDTSVFERWPYVDGNGRMSSDGGFVLYYICNEPVGGTTLIVQSLKDSWSLRVPMAQFGEFTKDSRYIIFRQADSLCLFSLKSKKMEWLGRVELFRICNKGDYNYLVYSIKGGHILVLKDLNIGKDIEIHEVRDFLISDEGDAIFLTTISENKGGGKKWLYRLTMGDMGVLPIWSTSDSSVDIRLGSIACDRHKRQIAFCTHFGLRSTIWCYSLQSKEAILLADDSTLKMDKDVAIDDLCRPGFTRDGERLFVKLSIKADSLPPQTSVPVDIWNYKDLKLQSLQLYELEHPNANQYIGVLSIDDPRMIRLNYEDEYITLLKGNLDTLALISKWAGGSQHETNWNPYSSAKNYLVSTISGKRNQINLWFANMSPTGKYIVGLDRHHQFIYVFDRSSMKMCNISDAVPPSYRVDEDYDLPGLKSSALSIAGWLPNDSAVILYDKYDIWIMDPTCRRKAVNLTSGYGRRHHVRLRLIGGYKFNAPFSDGATYVLSAFDLNSKESGFVTLTIKHGVSLKRLLSAPFHYGIADCPALDSNWLQIDGRTTFLVHRESASQSLNLFATKDFLSFSPVSSIYPEKEYNWLTAEVVSWRVDSVKRLAGVLYKPQNFDPKKKYPVIINYYEQVSNGAYEYKRPAYSGDDINIPWFVSRGYLVFRPDIRYRIGHPSASVCESIVSGTRFLMQFPWVDPTRIAIEGHSWGGVETNYLVTHSDLYCAALSGSSITDAISDYSSLMKNGDTKQFFYELDQCRIGSVPWGHINFYVENSPVLYADRVHTPVLFMNNKEDAGVAFSQGVEFFTALRRLHKKAWLLQYDGEGHGVSGRAAMDYTIRMTQFFDHYCKGAPAPKWMTKGVPARLKGIDSGLELETSGREA